jgi:hypothetical protein
MKKNILIFVCYVFLTFNSNYIYAQENFVNLDDSTWEEVYVDSYKNNRLKLTNYFEYIITKDITIYDNNNNITNLKALNRAYKIRIFTKYGQIEKIKIISNRE